MKKLVMCAAVAALALTTTMARADDWRSGLYVKGAGGYNITRDEDYSSNSHTELDNGYALSGAVGYNYGDWRTELEVAYRNNGVDKHKIGGTTLAGSDGETTSTAFMVNGYYDIPTGTAFTPYLGAGIGVAQVNINDYRAGGVKFADDDDTVFAYQGIAGVDYAINPNMGAFAEYKYFATSDVDIGNTSTSYDNHTLMAGLRYSFN